MLLQLMYTYHSRCSCGQFQQLLRISMQIYSPLNARYCCDQHISPLMCIYSGRIHNYVEVLHRVCEIRVMKTISDIMLKDVTSLLYIDFEASLKILQLQNQEVCKTAGSGATVCMASRCIQAGVKMYSGRC